MKTPNETETAAPAKKKRLRKPQGELPGMPKPNTAIEKSGRELKDAIEVEEQAKAEKEQALGKLIEAMKNRKDTSSRSINIDGYIFTYEKRPANEKIAIKRPR